MHKLELNTVEVDALNLVQGAGGDDVAGVGGDNGGHGDLGVGGEGAVVSRVVVRHEGDSDAEVNGAGDIAGDGGQTGGVEVRDGSRGGSAAVEGLHQRLVAVGDGWLRSRTVGGGEATRRVLVLGTAAVAEELCVLGHQDGAGIVGRDGAGVEGAGQLGDRSGDARHCEWLVWCCLVLFVCVW